MKRCSFIKKFIIVAIFTVTLVGCASGSPIDFLIPTKTPMLVTKDYLGMLYTTNSVNKMYHSLSDTKIEKHLIELRKVQLQGSYVVAKGEIALIEELGDRMSTGAWLGITAVLGAAGIMVPRPQEKTKINKAGLTDSREFTVI